MSPPAKNALLSTDKGAFFELSVPQAEREVCFASEARLRLVKCASRDRMRNTKLHFAPRAQYFTWTQAQTSLRLAAISLLKYLQIFDIILMKVRCI